MSASCNTNELHQRHGLSNTTLHRFVWRGILHPDGGGTSGIPYEWDEAEQRAAGAVIAFTRSHLMENRAKGHGYLHNALRAIAESARGHQPGDASVRWIMLLPDGTCLRVSDELAASWPEARTLIEIDPFTDRSPQRNA